MELAFFCQCWAASHAPCSATSMEHNGWLQQAGLGSDLFGKWPLLCTDRTVGVPNVKPYIKQPSCSDVWTPNCSHPVRHRFWSFLKCKVCDNFPHITKSWSSTQANMVVGPNTAYSSFWQLHEDLLTSLRHLCAELSIYKQLPTCISYHLCLKKWLLVIWKEEKLYQIFKCVYLRLR